MTVLAQQLDDYLRRADEATALRLQHLVREALALADAAKRDASPTRWPTGYFNNTAGALAGEPFERPDQGGFESREVW